MLEAHEDLEVVRLRLGKALDFEYNEVRFFEDVTALRRLTRSLVDRTRSLDSSRARIRGRLDLLWTLNAHLQNWRR